MSYIIFGFMFGILIGLFIRQGKFLGQLKKDHDALRQRMDDYERKEVEGNTLPTQQNKNFVELKGGEMELNRLSRVFLAVWPN